MVSYREFKSSLFSDFPEIYKIDGAKLGRDTRGMRWSDAKCYVNCGAVAKRVDECE